jgi:hypothetical protein
MAQLMSIATKDPTLMLTQKILPPSVRKIVEPALTPGKALEAAGIMDRGSMLSQWVK